MIPNEERLFARLRDLHATLGEDLDWLAANASRTDGLRDLGERLGDLGAALITRSDERDARTLANMPADRWVPAATNTGGRPRPAHHLGLRPVRCGLVYLAVCGAPCFPFYGRDTTGHTARHPRCPDCERRIPETERDTP